MRESPLRFVRGDMFTRNIPYNVHVNAVNCFGIMGAGVALQFKNQFPSMFLEYERLCKQGLIRMGQVTFHEIELMDMQSDWVVSFPTKNSPRNISHLQDISTGLEHLASILRAFPVAFHHIAIPALGCGLGGLEWPRVKQIMITHLADLPNELIDVYMPLDWEEE